METMRTGKGSGTRTGSVGRIARRAGLLLAALVVSAHLLPGVPGLSPAPAAAQAGPDEESPVRLGGLFRGGFQAGPAALDRRDGFEIFDAWVNASGSVGIVFDYFVQAEFDTDDQRFRLLDARLTFPALPELNVSVGQFKSPVSREFLKRKGDITFVNRSQIVQVVAPGRQVGAQLHGELLDGRLGYRAGVFNGNGRRLENDNDNFLWTGRVEFNNVGTVEFYDEVVVEVGANIAFSRDSVVNLSVGDRVATRFPELRMDEFTGDRLIWGFDGRFAYRGFFLRGEYLRGEFEARAAEGAPENPTRVAQGGWVEGGYNFFGAIEPVVRLDIMNDFMAPVTPAGGETVDFGREFLVFGAQVFPDHLTKVLLQYSVGLGSSRLGPGLADDEFTIMAQVDF